MPSSASGSMLSIYYLSICHWLYLSLNMKPQVNKVGSSLASLGSRRTPAIVPACCHPATGKVEVPPHASARLRTSDAGPELKNPVSRQAGALVPSGLGRAGLVLTLSFQA